MAKNNLEKEKLVKLADMFDLEAVIEIFADYSIFHLEFPQVESKKIHHGQQDGTKRKIFIDNTFDLAERRNTVIHEIYHVENRLRHFELPESGVRKVADIIDERLYGPQAKPEPIRDPNKSRLEQITNDFGLRDIIDILVEYNLIHIPLPDAKEIRYGMVNWSNRTIYINSTEAYHERRNAVIHEAVHVYSKDHHLHLNEKKVKKVANRIDKRLFKRLESTTEDLNDRGIGL